MATAVVRRYHEELWRASDVAIRRHANLGLLELIRGFSETLSKFKFAKSWDAMVNVPFSAALAVLHAMGWTVKSPTCFVDVFGFRAQLAYTMPD